MQQFISHHLTLPSVSRFGVILSLVVAFCGTLFCADLLAEEIVSQSDVLRWVARLDADRRTDRLAAEKELLRMGPVVLKWLPEPESLGSRSTVEAVRRVRVQLERQQAERSVEAGRLAIGESPTLKELIPRIVRETGNIVIADDLAAEVLAKTLRLPERPTFWTLLEALRDQHSLIGKLEGSPVRVRLLSRSSAMSDECLLRSELASAQSKAFRVALRSAKPRAIAGESVDSLMRLEMEVASEPRLRPLFLKCAASDLRVTSRSAASNSATVKNEATAKDERWLPFAPETKLELTFGQGGRQLVLPLDFRLPELARRDVVSLSGRMFVQTAAAEVPIEFPAGAESRGVSRRKGGVTVKVLNWLAENVGAKHSLEVTASVTYDTGGPAFESHRSWMLFNIAGLVRAGMMATEKPLQPAEATSLVMLKPNDIETDAQPDGSIAVVYRFLELPLPASEYRFRYVAPTLILDVPVEFEMREVRLSSQDQ